MKSPDDSAKNNFASSILNSLNVLLLPSFSDRELAKLTTMLSVMMPSALEVRISSTIVPKPITSLATSGALASMVERMTLSADFSTSGELFPCPENCESRYWYTLFLAPLLNICPPLT